MPELVRTLLHPKTTMSLKVLSQNKVYDGFLTKYSFVSSVLGNLEAKMNVFVPAQASASNKVPVLYYLSGLTCTEDNAAQKGHMFKAAADEQLAIVFPDASPRGAGIPGEDDSWDLGTGAGGFVNATREPWSKHYHMYDHVVKEIPDVIQKSNLPIDTGRASVLGHSFGGHGAMIIYLREQGKYRSASAFAPICHPTACDVGKKLFENYLAGGVEEAKQYDTAILLSQQDPKRHLDILVDCGLNDNFYKDNQLQPESLIDSARKSGIDSSGISVRLRGGYDHSCTFTHLLLTQTSLSARSLRSMCTGTPSSCVSRQVLLYQ